MLEEQLIQFLDGDRVGPYKTAWDTVIFIMWSIT